MNYFDNGPYLKSLQKQSKSACNVTTILITALVVVSTISVYQYAMLQQQNKQLALIQQQLAKRNIDSDGPVTDDTV